MQVGKVCQTASRNHAKRVIVLKYYLGKKYSNTLTYNNSKNAFPVFIQKSIKTVIKCIACAPAGVVQHRLIAGPCGPLRVLFIVCWCVCPAMNQGTFKYNESSC